MKQLLWRLPIRALTNCTAAPAWTRVKPWEKVGALRLRWKRSKVAGKWLGAVPRERHRARSEGVGAATHTTPVPRPHCHELRVPTLTGRTRSRARAPNEP